MTEVNWCEPLAPSKLQTRRNPQRSATKPTRKDLSRTVKFAAVQVLVCSRDYHHVVVLHTKIQKQQLLDCSNGSKEGFNLQSSNLLVLNMINNHNMHPKHH